MTIEFNQEKNRIKRRDKQREKEKYAPKVHGMPLGFSKGHWYEIKTTGKKHV